MGNAELLQLATEYGVWTSVDRCWALDSAYERFGREDTQNRWFVWVSGEENVWSASYLVSLRYGGRGSLNPHIQSKEILLLTDSILIGFHCPILSGINLLLKDTWSDTCHHQQRPENHWLNSWLLQALLNMLFPVAWLYSDGGGNIVTEFIFFYVIFILMTVALSRMFSSILQRGVTLYKYPGTSYTNHTI